MLSFAKMLSSARSEEGSLRDEIPQAGFGACGPNVSPDAHPLTEPAVRPEISVFWPKMNTRMEGTRIMMVPAITGP